MYRSRQDSQPTEWTLEGFCDHFSLVHEKMRDHKFAWILGAGASRASSIPTGGELVEDWLRELHVRLDGGTTPFEEMGDCTELGHSGI